MTASRTRRRVSTMPFDPADFLQDDATIVAYLNEVLTEGDPAALIDALGTVARARGMASLARVTGLGRESLYKALRRDGNPSFRTVVAVAAALGYRFDLRIAASRRTRVAGSRHKL